VNTTPNSARPSLSTVEVSIPGHPYPVVIGPGARRRFVSYLAPFHLNRTVWITDRNVAGLWGDEIRSLSGTAAPDLVVLPAGEEQKRLATVEDLCRRFVQLGVERHDTLVACGGGVIGDVVGFAAACYLRGVNFVQLPTTLLAMVDSSVGGKTGVDLPEGKNLVGAFHQPRFVLADPDFLATLPERELRSGLAEVIKTALISGPKLFTELRSFVKRHPDLQGPDLAGLIESCVDFKAGVVEKDEREGGLRRILNFGHTVGHALECLGQYRTLKHGEAVLWGLSAALDLSVRRAGLDPRLETDIQAFLAPFLTAIPPLEFDSGEVLDLLARDKKVRRKVVQFVLLRGVGLPVVTPLADPQILIAALDHLRDRMRAGAAPEGEDREIRD